MVDYKDKYSVNESLLQSYRSLFTGSQSFILAVGAFLWDSNRILMISIAAIALVIIWVLWVPVVVSRSRIVDLYKYADKYHKKHGIDPIADITEKAYVHSRKTRETVNRTLEIATNWRPTRLKIDIALPILYTVMWFLLVVANMILVKA